MSLSLFKIHLGNEVSRSRESKRLRLHESKSSSEHHSVVSSPSDKTERKREREILREREIEGLETGRDGRLGHDDYLDRHEPCCVEFFLLARLRISMVACGTLTPRQGVYLLTWDIYL